MEPTRLATSKNSGVGLILFLGMASQHRTEARSISGAAALQRILPQSLLAIQSDVSARHFEVLAQLVSQSRSYDLLLGPDIDYLPALVRTLLA